MKHWKKNVLLGKGARSPRDSSNFQQKEEMTAERELKVLNGGNKADVTHPEPRRRGSRLRKGENRTSRKYTRRTNGVCREVVDLDDYRRNRQPDTATTGGELAENSTNQDAPPSPTTPIEVERPPIVRYDFSPEAIAADKARHAALALSFAEGRAVRKGLENAVEKKRQKEMGLVKKLLGGRKTSPEPKPDPSLTPTPVTPVTPPTTEHDQCVYHLEFGPPKPDPLVPPAPRCSLNTSYTGTPKKRKRAKAESSEASPSDSSEKPRPRRRRNAK